MYEVDISRKRKINENWFRVIFCLLLVSTLVLIYSQVKSFEFVNFDDPIYVTGNMFIRHGFTLDGIACAFNGIYASMWHPLTWISHMMDIQLFGMDPGMHHLTSVVLHILNSILLFFLFERMTGTLWRSAAVAALFALHPIHVESVAWISERKDVLSTFFLILTMLSYYRYTRTRTIGSYLLVVVTYSLGIMAKPMLVTLPFLLLLLDFWPLRRQELFPYADSLQAAKDVIPLINLKGAFKLVLEKAPLMIMAFVVSGVTYYAQLNGGVVNSLDRVPAATRLQNIITAYATYLGKMIWPMHLAVYYPYRWHFSIVAITAYILFLSIVTIAALISARRSPYFTIGWFWYMGVLVPVVGIVQVGSQAMADRYSYISLVGIFVIIVWGLTDLIGRTRLARAALLAALIVVLVSFAGLSWIQVGTWKDSETLFSHAIAVTKDNHMAHNNLGVALYERGDVEGAMEEYRESLRIMPSYVNANCNLGLALAGRKLYAEAFNYYQKCIHIKPEYSEAHYNMGVALSDMGRKNDAIVQYREVLKNYPKHENAHNNLGTLLAEKGDLEGAIYHYRKAIETNPYNVRSRLNLADVWMRLNRKDDAAFQIYKALAAEPRNPYLYTRIGDIYSQKKDMVRAIDAYQKALTIAPEFSKARQGLVRIHRSKS
jgi:protein O-mannosyl-transferase